MTAAQPAPDGAIRVRTTERGLPVEVILTSAAVELPPERLAREILLRCQVSARRAQLLRREGLLANGVGRAVVDSLGLSTAEQLAEVEAQVAGEVPDDDGLPSTWLRPR